MKINARGLDLIKSFEGCELVGYLCPAGVPTIGFGSTGPHVKVGARISQAEAEELLRRDLARFEECVAILVRGCATTPDQFAAMVSLAFNIGGDKFAKSSVLRYHKAGDFAAAARSFSLWNKARVGARLVPLKGLTRRRAEEARLYGSEL